MYVKRVQRPLHGASYGSSHGPACLPPRATNAPSLVNRPQVHARGKTLGKDVDFEKIARRTPGFTGGRTRQLARRLPCFLLASGLGHSAIAPAPAGPCMCAPCTQALSSLHLHPSPCTLSDSAARASLRLTPPLLPRLQVPTWPT